MKPLIMADDQQEYHDRLLSAFSKELPDLEIETVMDGKELIRRCLDKEYSLIITDHQMGIPEGLYVSRRLRSKGIKTPIFLHSSANFPPEQIEMYGVTKAFSKDYGSGALIDAVIEFYKQ